MGMRRKSRECALQVLFQADINGEEPETTVYFEHHRVSKRIEDFARHLISGCGAHRDQIDTLITEYSVNWSVDRIGAIERNIMRIAAFELLFEWTTPPKVVIDEAIEVSKKFGPNESHAFVNGVLDGIRKGIEQGKIACAKDTRQP